MSIINLFFSNIRGLTEIIDNLLSGKALNIYNLYLFSSGGKVLGLLSGDIEKVPSNLDLRQLYQRIYNWHKTNSDNSPHIPFNENSRNHYLNLVQNLPKPKDAKTEDIFFICNEVICGVMEWAYHQEDDFGVKTAAYAHYIADKYAGGLSNMQKLAKSSKMGSTYQKR
jgi:hypothetical protein